MALRELLQDLDAVCGRAAREQPPCVGGDQRPGRMRGAGQRGQQCLALRPAAPRVISAAALVEIHGGHLTAVGGHDGAAQGELPVPFCLAVLGAGGVSGPAVEHHRRRPDPGLRISSGQVVCQEHSLSHPQACGAGGADRGSGFSSPDSPSLRQLICGGAAPGNARPPSARHAACRVHRGTWTRRPASSASALGVVCPFPGAQEHGQDSPGGTWGQLRLSRSEGHLDQLALSRLCSATHPAGPGRRACRRSCPPPGRHRA